MERFLFKGTTAAFFVQSIISFMVSMAAVTVGIVFLPAPMWVRGFLALGMLYVTTSTFTLAKCVRDRQEAVNAPRPGQPGSPLPPNAPYVESPSGSWG